MKIVEFESPQGLDLNIMKKNSNFQNIYQTVNIYDLVKLSSKSKQKGIYIFCDKELDSEIKEKIIKTVEIFSIYCNKKIDSLEISINLNDVRIDNSYLNIIAGLISGLDYYFNTNLKMHELIYLGKQIDNLLEYYLLCGYKGISANRILSVGKNIYDEYLFIKSKDDSLEFLKKIKNYLEKIKNINYGKINNYYFVSVSGNIQASLPISIKRDLKNVSVYTGKNVSRHKVLVKY